MVVTYRTYGRYGVEGNRIKNVGIIISLLVGVKGDRYHYLKDGGSLIAT